MVDCVPDTRLIELTALGLEHFREQHRTEDVATGASPPPRLEVGDLVPEVGHFLTVARPDLINDAIVRCRDEGGSVSIETAPATRDRFDDPGSVRAQEPLILGVLVPEPPR
jgi:hypothetical protein